MNNPIIHPAHRTLLACSVVTLVLVACSSSDPGAMANRSASKPPATSGAAGASTGPATPNPQSGTGNAPTTLLPTPTATGTAGTPSQPAQQPTQSTSISREPIAIDDCGANNAAGLSADVAQKLKAGGGGAGTLRMLYPYDGTVFPRGMLAPDLMWDGAAAEAVYVHIKSKIFEYWGCLKPTDPSRVTLAQDVWDKAGQRSFGRDDDYQIDVSVYGAGAVVGPATLHIDIAQAAIKGSIYYNTYRSNLTGGGAPGADPGGIPGGFGIPGGGFPGGGFPGGGFPGGGASNGIVVRIPPGGHAEVFGQTDCNGCHSVSADGSLLLAQSVAGGAYSYQLDSSGGTPMPTMAGALGSWVALYPDGSAALSMSTVIDVARAGIFGGMAGGTGNAALFDTKTGQPIASNGIPAGALMPFFSPDGTYLTFNDYAAAEAHGIALMRYDTATHTASEYNVLYQEPAGNLRPGWPFVLPDDHAVVFVRTDDFDFTGGGVGVSGDIAGGIAAPFSELSIADAASKSVTLLAKAMGYNTPEDATNNTTYLPFGAEDLHHAYYPTVSPVGGGGYFWVFFDSVRHYGSLGVQRQLWGAALDISSDGTYTRDPSHPAFYVTGQEFGTGNHRAFAALDPCRKDGDKCSSGIDCCGGFCYIDKPVEFDEPVGSCSPQMMVCAKRDERCRSPADCCATDPSEPPHSCIAGFCTPVPGPS